MFLLVGCGRDAQLCQPHIRLFFLAQRLVPLRLKEGGLLSIASDLFFKFRALLLELLNLCVCRCDLALESRALKFERLQFALCRVLFAFELGNFRRRCGLCELCLLM